MQVFGSGQDSIVDAGLWLQQLLLGRMATIVAVLAVAATGAAMLAGRIDIRRGVTIIAGCFLLFGAPAIAAGMRAVLSGDDSASAEQAPRTTSEAPPVPKPAAPYDPYAGAAVPQQR